MIIKSPMNALHNVKNPYQGPEKRVLCLCSAGLLRSARLAQILQQDYGYNTRNAGVADYALIPVSTALLEWADEIVCVEKEVFDTLMNDLDKYEKQHNEHIESHSIIVLNIPDIYERMNPTLQRICIEQYEEAINEK